MLSLGVSQGSKINVGGHLIEVIKIISPHLMLITVDSGNLEIVISNQKKEEILPQVYVQTGAKDNDSGHRLAFDAPRGVKILRIN